VAIGPTIDTHLKRSNLKLVGENYANDKLGHNHMLDFDLQNFNGMHSTPKCLEILPILKGSDFHNLRRLYRTENF
jgi:hypothetical protein